MPDRRLLGGQACRLGPVDLADDRRHDRIRPSTGDDGRFADTTGDPPESTVDARVFDSAPTELSPTHAHGTAACAAPGTGELRRTARRAQPRA